MTKLEDLHPALQRLLRIVMEHWDKVKKTEEGSDVHPDVMIERWEDEGGTIEPHPDLDSKGPPCE